MTLSVFLSSSHLPLRTLRSAGYEKPDGFDLYFQARILRNSADEIRVKGESGEGTKAKGRSQSALFSAADRRMECATYLPVGGS